MIRPTRRPRLPGRPLLRGLPLLLGLLCWTVSLGLREVMVRHWPFLGLRTIDLATYYQAVQSLHHGQQGLYTRHFGAWPGPFIYPPFAALVFRALSPLGFAGLQTLMGVASLLALPATLWASWTLLGRRWTARAAGALAALGGLSLWLVPVERTLCFGQVSLVLLAAVLVDCALPDRWRGKGVLVGLAAGFKLVPGLFILYFLLTRRYRAAVVATGGLLATIVVGALALPRAARIYWLHTVGVPQQINQHVSMADATNQAIRPLLLRTFGEGRTSSALWVLLGLAVLLLGMAAARRADARGQRLLGVCLCGWVGVLISPISWTHHWVWVLPTLVLMGTAYADAREPVRRWRAALVIAVTIAVSACWPLRLDFHGGWSPQALPLPNSLVMLGPHLDGRDLHWTPAQWWVGNSMVLLGLALFAVTVGAVLSAAPRPARDTEDPSRPCRSTQQPSPQQSSPQQPSALAGASSSRRTR